MKSTLYSRVLLLLALGFSGSEVSAQASFNPINDSTTARYRYEVIEEEYAQVPDGVTIEDLHLLQKDQLYKTNGHYRITEGVNNNQNRYFQVEDLGTELLEDWLSVPKIQLITPTHSIGFDSIGEEAYSFPINQTSLTHRQDFENQQQTTGFSPIMMFFPNKRDEFVTTMINSGANLQELTNEDFKLSWSDQSMLFIPSEKRIVQEFSLQGTSVVQETTYKLFSPYGFVKDMERIYKTDDRFDIPVTKVVRKKYLNHVIEDLNSSIPKFTDHQEIQVYPNPVASEYDIVLKGINPSLVNQIQVRDHFGNLVYTHNSFNASEGVIHLNADQYTSGILVILVQTANSTYSTTLTKI